MAIYRIYFDVCCLNRPFDDQLQDRIRLETEAIRLIFRRIESGDTSWITSAVVEDEILQTRDAQRRDALQALTAYAVEKAPIIQAVIQRANDLEKMGFHGLDALHLAVAESASVDVFLSVDDRLLRRASRFEQHLNVDVQNPLLWMQEEWKQ